MVLGKNMFFLYKLPNFEFIEFYDIFNLEAFNSLIFRTHDQKIIMWDVFYSKHLVTSHSSFVIYVRYFLTVGVPYRSTDNPVNSLININWLSKPQVVILVENNDDVLIHTVHVSLLPVTLVMHVSHESVTVLRI